MRRVAVLCILFLLFGCTKKESESGHKVLNYPVGVTIKGFDPMKTNDVYSHIAQAQVYQGLLQYDYRARPYKLEPLLAERMPTISEDGLTYTFQIRKNVFFHDDPAFGGKKRKLRASDFIYSFKRLADPHIKSPNWWMLADRIKGLNEFREKLRNQSIPINYDAHSVEGLKAPDDHTLVIMLTKPYRQLTYVLVMKATAALAREVVERYGEEFVNHPVGTGPFVLKDWRHGQKIRYVRNPNYWNDVDSATGKRLPYVDEVVLWVYVESLPQWLNFLRGSLDLSGIPKDAFHSVLDDNKELKEEFRRKGIKLRVGDPDDIVYYPFNMRDPVVGTNPYLRKAISLAMNRMERIDLFYNNRAVEAQGVIPPATFGYDETVRNPYPYDVTRAKKMMVKARDLYTKKSGKSEIPPLTYDITSSTTARQMAESMAQELSKIGLKLDVRVGSWPQFQERLAKGETQFFGHAWSPDYPDPENFLQLLYSKNATPGPNASNFSHPEYDRLYEKMRNMDDTPEKKAIILRMTKIVHEEVPWVLFSHRIPYGLSHAWVSEVKRNPYAPGSFKYLDIDPQEKRKRLPLLQ